MPKLYFLIIPYGFPDAFEYAADAWVSHRMKRLLRSEHDCRQFLRLLNSHAKANGFVNGRGKPQDLMAERLAAPKGDRAFSPIENHLRSHPAAYDRLDRLKEIGVAPHP